MPINEYMSPNINQHQNTHVDTYQPIDFQFLGGALAKKQAEYDAGEVLSHNITDNIKINPYFNEHKKEAAFIKDKYRAEIDQVLQDAGGNYALATPKLQDIGRRLQDDLQYGSIAKINSATAAHLGEIANIKSISEKSGINGLDQIAHLNKQAAAYDTPENASGWYSPFTHGQRIKFNDILDKAAGNLRVDGRQWYDTKDPNYLTKLGKEYLTNQKVHDALYSTIKEQPGIEYEAMLDLGLNSPEEITEAQLKEFVNRKIQGTVTGATFLKTTTDKNETETGKLAAKRKDLEIDNITGGLIDTQKIVNPTGATAPDVKENYKNINATNKTAIQNAYAATGITPNSIITTSNGDFKLSDLNDRGYAPTILKAIKEGKFTIKGADQSVMDKFKNTIVPVLLQNEAIEARVNESVNKVAKDNFQPGIRLYEVKGQTGLQSKATPSIEVDEATHKKLVHSALTGEQGGDAYVQDGLWVIKGKKYNPQTGGASQKLFKDSFGYDKNTIQDQFDKHLDETGEDEKKIVYSKDMGNVNTPAGPESTTKMFTSLGNTITQNSGMLKYYDPKKPYLLGADNLTRNQAIASSLDIDEGNIEDVKAVPFKEGGVQFSNTPINNTQVAMQKFIVTYADGKKEDVYLKTTLDDQIVGTALQSQEAKEEWRLNAKLSTLKGSGNEVSLKDNAGNTIGKLNNSNNIVKYVNENGDEVSTTLENYLKNPAYRELLLNQQ